MDNEKVHNEKNATWIKSKLKTQTEKSATEKKRNVENWNIKKYAVPESNMKILRKNSILYCTSR